MPELGIYPGNWNYSNMKIQYFVTYFFYPRVIFLFKVVYQTITGLILSYEPHQSITGIIRLPSDQIVSSSQRAKSSHTSVPGTAKSLIRAAVVWLTPGSTGRRATAPSWPVSSCCLSPGSSFPSCSSRPIIGLTPHYCPLEGNWTKLDWIKPVASVEWTAGNQNFPSLSHLKVWS